MVNQSFQQVESDTYSTLKTQIEQCKITGFHFKLQYQRKSLVLNDNCIFAGYLTVRTSLRIYQYRIDQLSNNLGADSPIIQT